MSELRQRQRELTRTTITEAAAALVSERRHLDFTMKEIAQRAGVSLRTLYNHFATREDLLDELGRQVERLITEAGGVSAHSTTSLGDIVEAIGHNYALFEQLGGISEAFAQMPLEDVGRNEARIERTERIVSLFEAELGSVPRKDARAIALMLRHLMSHRSWFWLTREYGLERNELTDITTWAIETLVEAAAGGNHPYQTEET